MIIAQHFVIIISIGVNFVFILLDGIFNDGCSPRFNVVGSRLQIIGGTLLKCTRGSSCSMSTRSTCLVFPVLEYCPWMIMDTPRCENPRIFLTLGFYVKSIFVDGKLQKWLFRQLCRLWTLSLANLCHFSGTRILREINFQSRKLSFWQF